MTDIELKIIQDPAAAEDSIALLHNPMRKTLSFQLWDLSLDYNYDPTCPEEFKRQRYITKYILDDELNDSIDRLFKVNGRKTLKGSLTTVFNLYNTTTRFITIGGIKGVIKIDQLPTIVSELHHMEMEVEDARLSKENYLNDNSYQYSMYLAILNEDYHIVKEYFLQQNIITNALNFARQYFPFAVQAKCAPEFFEVFFSSGIFPNVIYHQLDNGVDNFINIMLESMRNKEMVDVLIKYDFDFNYQTNKAKSYNVEQPLEMDFYHLPIFRGLSIQSTFSEFGEWHAACRYMIDEGGADIDAKFCNKRHKHDINCMDDAMTILAYLSTNSFTHQVQRLLELGANPDIQYKGKYIWEFCNNNDVCKMVLFAHESRKAHKIPIHRFRRIFVHQGLPRFLEYGTLEHVKAALDVGANPDALATYEQRGVDGKTTIIMFDSSKICRADDKDKEKKCEMLETASKNIAYRREQMRRSKLDAQILPSRRYVPANISYIQDKEYNKHLDEFRRTLLYSSPQTTTSSSSSSTAEKRAYQSDYDEEFTHRFSKLRPNIDEKKQIAKQLDAAHGNAAVRRELAGVYKEAFDATAKFGY